MLLGATAAAETIVHAERSALQPIVVVDRDGRRCLRLDDSPTGLNQSCVDLAAPARLAFGYARAMVVLTLNWQPEPRRILVIGVGGGSIPMALAAALPAVHIDAVDIDPAVLDVARRYFGLRSGEGLRVIAADGRDFVFEAVRAGRRYDAVLLDAFDADGIPPPLFDAGFLAAVRRLLSPGGLFVANTFAAGPRHEDESRAAASAFGRYLDIVPGEASGNRLIVASTAGLPAAARLRAVPAARRADFERIGASAHWLSGWRIADGGTPLPR
jgi:spermidine synthase